MPTSNAPTHKPPRSHIPKLSQKHIQGTLPPEVKNLIKTKNVDAVRAAIQREEKMADAKFRSGTLNTRQLDKMFKNLEIKVDKLEEELLKEATKIIPFKKGGTIPKTGVYLMHKGEKVTPKV